MSPPAAEARIDPANWEPPAANASPLDRLEVVGVGLLVEKSRMRELWAEVKASAGKSVVQSDATNQTVTMRSMVSSQRRAAGLEWALRPFVEGWTVPNTVITRVLDKPESIDWARTHDHVDSLRQPAGLHWHLTKKFEHLFSDVPDEALERMFRLFDVNPDCPAAVVYVSNYGYHHGPGKPGDATEAVVALVLARRERVDWLRNFVPYVAKEERRDYPEFERWIGTPPVQFNATPCIPKPWTKEQFAQLDRLPTIAVLHRPIVVSYRKDGGAKMADREREAAFAAGWARALALLPKTADGALHPRAIPARIFFDHGDASGARGVVPVTVNLMHDPDPNALRLNVLDPKFGFNTFNILGETSIASSMVQWALASIATWVEQDVSVTLNLRNPDEATITVVIPDNRPDNRERPHPGGNPVEFPLRPR